MPIAKWNEDKYHMNCTLVDLWMHYSDIRSLEIVRLVLDYLMLQELPPTVLNDDGVSNLVQSQVNFRSNESQGLSVLLLQMTVVSHCLSSVESH